MIMKVDVHGMKEHVKQPVNIDFNIVCYMPIIIDVH